MSYDDYRYPQAPPGGGQAYPYDQAGYPQASGSYYGTGPAPGSQSILGGWFDFRNPNYLKGMLIAAGVTFLVANPKVQKALLKGTAKPWSPPARHNPPRCWPPGS